MKEPVEQLLKVIDKDVKGIPRYDDSVLKNLGGLLFTAEYAAYKGESIDTELNRFVELIDNYEIPENKHQTFSEGYLSIGTVFRRLVHLGFFEENEELEAAIEEIAILSARRELATPNFDLLYGATGIVHYLLAGKQNAAIELLLREYTGCLQQHIILLQGGTAWADHYHRLRTDGAVGINLGLAHGIPAILKSLVSLKDCVPETDKASIIALIRSTATFLMQAVNQTPGFGSIYGSYWVPGEPPKDELSRLGWCYGDLSMGVILFQAGAAIAAPEISAYGENLVLLTTTRKTRAETMIHDAGLCHGTAGVAHLYHRMWRDTGNSRFSEATDFWVQQTLDLARPEEGTSGFKKYNPVTRQPETELGFLEGTAGIGLALLSYLSGDLSWDHTLMLDRQPA